MSIVESCLDKTFSDRLSSFERSWSSLFHLLMVPQRSLLQIDKASLLDALLKCLCFKIIDKANTKFDLKIKEALHINWRKPNLTTQQNHFALTLSL